MAGLLFPDIAGALSSGAQAGAASAQGRFLMEDRAAKNEIAPLIPRALQGDKEALGQIGTRHPDTLLKITPLLERMDTNQRARAKEAAEWTTRAAMGVLSLPPEQRPAAYQAALAEGQKLGFQIDMPPQYDRAVEGRLNQVINQARPLADYFKDRSEGFELVPSGGGGAAPLDRSSGAIAGIESGGRYDAVGPVANSKGNRAFGKYQIMDFNVGPWTQEVLGKAMTPQEFVASPQAQDAVFKAKFGQYVQKYGSPEAAARAWFAGEGGMNNPGATDVLGTSVQGYGQKFAQAYGPGATGPGPQVAQGDNTRADGSGTPIPTSDGGTVPLDAMRMITPNLPPGTFIGRDRKTGKFIVQEGNFVVYDANKNPVGMIPVPKAQGTGPFTGKSPEAEGLNLLVQTGVLTARQAAELAAGKTITDPKTGVVMFATPTGLMGQAPNGQTAPIVPPGGPAAPPVGGAMPGASPGGVPSAAPPTVAPEARPGMIPLTTPKPETMTEGQAKAYGFAQRMATANSILDDLAIQGTSKRGRFLEGLPGGLGNLAQTPEFQRFEQAKRNFMNAQLRDESGAVIGPSEFMSADLQYFPQPGQETNKELIAQMAENRRQVVEAMMVKAGMLKRGERYDPPAKTVDPAEKGRLLFDAKKAIAEGRDPKLVRERLKKLGVDPAELDGAN